MNLNKCERCGCFFATADTICPNCVSKDESDVNKLKSFLSLNEEGATVNDVIEKTGVSMKNVNRFLANKELNKDFLDLGLVVDKKKNTKIEL